MRPNVLITTDHVGEAPENGAQVFADAMVHALCQWYDVTVVVRAGAGRDETARLARTGATAKHEDCTVLRVPPEEMGTLLPAWLDARVEAAPGTVLYNLGGTVFSNVAALAIRQRHPVLPLVNHFQVNLRRYAEIEGREPEICAELEGLQRAVAIHASGNLFTSFSELHLARASEWPMAPDSAAVVPNAFVGSGASAAQPGRRLPRPFTIVAAGRFGDHVKGGDLLLRAFGEVRSRHAGGVRLVVAGDPEPLAPLIPRRWRDDVTLLGWVSRRELHYAMQAGDLVVVPSRYEPFGLVALEALAMGTPVVAMALGGLAEIVDDGVTGWLTPPADGSLGLQLAMEEAVANPDATRRMGLEGQRLARQAYTLPRVAREVYRHLERARRGPAWPRRAETLLRQVGSTSRGPSAAPAVRRGRARIDGLHGTSGA